MKCIDCPSWNKEDGCEAHPTEILDTLCLLRHIAVTLNALSQKIDGVVDEGEDWKIPS